MNTKAYILLLVVLFSIGACRPRYDQTPVFSTMNDFENVVGWTDRAVNNSNTVTAETSHSGRYSSKIDKNNNYSFFFKQKLKQATAKKITWARVSVWCKYTGDLKYTNLSCFLTDDANTIKMWTEVKLVPEMNGQKNKWVYIKKNLNLSDYTDSELNFNAFVWNTGKDEEMFIDDMKIEFFE